MKFERKQVALALAQVLGIGGAMVVVGTPAQAQDIRVNVTGSSIKRVEAEGALPIDTVTRDDIARSGAQTVEQLLSTLSSFSSQNAVSGAGGVGASTYGRSTVSLRGLGDSRSLILVNGKRMAPFPSAGGGAAVNVNSIPLAAIERVEVLKDGASAVYGSDAIAGVVNFILVKNYNGVEAEVTAGTPTRSGGGQSITTSAVGGWGDLNKDRFNLTISGSYVDEQQLFAKDRDFAKTGNVPPYLTSGATGQGNIEGAYTPGTGSAAAGTWKEGKPQPGFGTSPGAGYGNPLAATNQCGTINMFQNPRPTSKGAPYCTFDSAAFVGLIPEKQSANFTANLVWKLTDTMEFFGDGLFANTVVTQRFQPNPVRRSFLTTDDQFKQQGIDPALLLLPKNFYYKTAADYLTAKGFGSIVGQPLAITSRVFDFGERTSTDTNDAVRVVAGLRGEIWKQDWALAYTYNESKLNGTVPAGYFSQTAFAKVVQGSSNGTPDDWNPWSLNQSTAFKQKVLDSQYAGGTLAAKATTQVVDGNISGDVWQLPAGPLQYAAGFQFRRESYETTPSAALFTGDIAGLGGATAPVDRARDIKALYLEVNVPIIKDLEVNAAVRSDNYSDFGTTTNWKASARWQPIKSLLLRASAGTGFRAPTLTDLWLPQTVGASEQFTDPAFPNNPNIQVNNVSGGNPLLQPETSKQYSLGVVWAPIPSLSLGVDYWNIKLDQIITTPSAQEVVSQFRKGDPAYKNLVILTPDNQVDQISTFLYNTGSATVSGYDVEVNWKETFSFGNVFLNILGTYMNKYDQVSPGGDLSHKVGTMISGSCLDDSSAPVLDANGGGVILRWKSLSTLGWSQGPWSASIVQNWYNGYQAGCQQLASAPTYVPSQQIYDLYFAYTGVKNLKLAIGAKNIFDKNPPIYVPVSNQFQAGYDVSLYDPKSRFVYFTLGYKFF